MAARETRQQIVDVADRLFYERGFEATSFADIAKDVGLSRGNFYYHFKTKDDILGAVIAQRMSRTRALLKTWEKDADTPAERILSFVRILIANRTEIMAHGCPAGTLCTELARLDHAARDDATGLLSLFRNWLAGQFAILGREADADALALHILMRSQGVATLATAFSDENFIRREVADIETWLHAQCSASSLPQS
jgi:TetR/AcrR family transcriptional repressor of nem operon